MNKYQLMNCKDQHQPKNIKSKKFDERISESTALAAKDLILFYPDHKFLAIPRTKDEVYFYENLNNFSIKVKNEDKFNICDISDAVKGKYGEKIEVLGSNQNRNRGFLNSDSGVIKVYTNKQWEVIYLAEGKDQGTNDQLVLKGKKPQCMGNAGIDRAGANIDLYKTYWKIRNIDINPFVVFFEGCDFKEGSYIKDRLYKYTYGLPFNKIYVHPPIEERPASIFVQSDHWSIEDLKNISLEVMKQSMDYYIKKNGN